MVQLLLTPPWVPIPSVSPPAAWVLLIHLQAMPVITSAPLKPPPLWVHQHGPPFALLEVLAWLLPTWDSPSLWCFSAPPTGLKLSSVPSLPRDKPVYCPSSCNSSSPHMPSELPRVFNTLEPCRSLSYSCNLIPFYQRLLCSMESGISSQHKSAHEMQRQCSI